MKQLTRPNVRAGEPVERAAATTRRGAISGKKRTHPSRLALLTASMVAASAIFVMPSPVDAGTYFNEPTVTCSGSQVQANAFIVEHPDYLRNTWSYFEMWLYVNNGGTWQWTGQSATGYVKPGQVSAQQNFSADSNREYRVQVRRRYLGSDGQWWWVDGKSGRWARTGFWGVDRFYYSNRYSCTTGY